MRDFLKRRLRVVEREPWGTYDTSKNTRLEANRMSIGKEAKKLEDLTRFKANLEKYVQSEGEVRDK